MSSRSLVRTTENPRLGILLMVTSTLLFSALWTLVKTLSEDYPLIEVTFFRNFFALVPVTVMVASNGRKVMRTRRFAGHVWRSAVGVAAMLLGFLSYHLLPLANAVAISFAAPLMVTALSVPFLGEKVGVLRWSAVVVGFVGVLVIVHPSGDMFHPGTLAAFGAAFGSAVAMVTIRQLNKIDRPVTIVFYFTLLSTVMTGLMLPFSWVTPSAASWGLLLLMGLTGGVGQYFMTRAFALAPAAVISPFNYAGLLWATILGWMFWGDLPASNVYIGSAVVIASGLFILYRETRLKHSGKPTSRLSQADDREKTR